MYKFFALNFCGPRSSKRGFSLVEVVLSLAIIAFAFTTMTGLLSIGLNQSRSAINASVTSQIVQQVRNELQQTDFNTITSSATQTKVWSATLTATATLQGQNVTYIDPPVRYFDSTGAELLTTTGGFYSAGTIPAGAVYWVLVNIQTPVFLPNTTTPNASLAKVTIQVAANPAKATLTPNSSTLLWPNTTLGVTVTTYSTQVAGSNQEL